MKLENGANLRRQSNQQSVIGKANVSGRRQKRASSAFLVLAALLAGGCGATRPSKYYELTMPRESAPAAASQPLPITLIVGRLMASHLYREDRIVYGTRGEEMGTYQYHRWAEPPTEMIQELLLRELGASCHYRGVYSLSSESRGDFLLRGRLFDFKEVSGDPLLARVSFDLELRDMKTDATVWTHSYYHDEPVDRKEVSAIVAALDRNTQRGVDEVRASLEEYFAAHPSRR